MGLLNAWIPPPLLCAAAGIAASAMQLYALRSLVSAPSRCGVTWIVWSSTLLAAQLSSELSTLLAFPLRRAVSPHPADVQPLVLC